MAQQQPTTAEMTTMDLVNDDDGGATCTPPLSPRLSTPPSTTLLQHDHHHQRGMMLAPHTIARMPITPNPAAFLDSTPLIKKKSSPPPPSSSSSFLLQCRQIKGRSDSFLPPDALTTTTTDSSTDSSMADDQQFARSAPPLMFSNFPMATVAFPQQQQMSLSSNSTYITKKCPATPLRTPIPRKLFGNNNSNSSGMRQTDTCPATDMRKRNTVCSDQFQFIARLGEGTFGTVDRVMWMKDGMEYALKKSKHKVGDVFGFDTTTPTTPTTTANTTQQQSTPPNNRNQHHHTPPSLAILTSSSPTTAEPPKKRSTASDSTNSSTATGGGGGKTAGEVWLLKELGEHRNIVQIKNAWEEDRTLYILTELCPGGSLKSYLEKNIDLSEEVVLGFAADMFNGVAHLHRHDIMHLDLKPDNLLLGFNNTLKIADFGLSVKNKQKYHHQHQRSTSSLRRSVSGFNTDPNDDSLMEEGDSVYMAPELLQDKFGFPADIFSLGITLYEMVTGYVLPSHGPDWHRLRNGADGDDGGLDFTEAQKFSEGLRALIREMMHPDPHKRPTAEQLINCDLIKPIIAKKTSKAKTLTHQLQQQQQQQHNNSNKKSSGQQQPLFMFDSMEQQQQRLPPSVTPPLQIMSDPTMFVMPLPPANLMSNSHRTPAISSTPTPADNNNNNDATPTLHCFTNSSSIKRMAPPLFTPHRLGAGTEADDDWF